MPVIGAIPIVIPMLTNTWNEEHEHDPARDDRAVEVARAGHDLQRPPDDEQVEQQQDRGAEEAALLGERGEREVGGVRGQVVEPRLRRAGTPRPRSPPAPTAIIDWRRLYVAPRGSFDGCVKPVRRCGLVGLEHVHPGRRQQPEHGERTDDGRAPPITARCDQRTPATKSTAASTADVDERRADVRLHEDEQRSAARP